MSSFLQSQIRNRAENVQSVADSLNQTKGGYFDEIKGAVENSYDLNLEQYADELNGAISKQIAQKSEGTNVLLQTPIFYNTGKDFYSGLGERGRQPFDYVANEVKRVAGDRIEDISQRVNDKLDEGKALIEKVKGKVSDFLDEGGLEGNAPRALVQEGEDGSLRVNLLQAESEQPEVNQSANEMRNISNESDLAEGRTPTGGIMISKPEGYISSEALAADQTIANTESVAPVIIGKNAAEAATVEDAIEPVAVADEALAETGIGAPVAGGLAVIGGIGLGLYELFGHHAHKPRPPNMPDFTPTAFQSQYNAGSAILANTSNVVNSAKGTMDF